MTFDGWISDQKIIHNVGVAEAYEQGGHAHPVFSGIVVASILKYLDNIVKEYTGSVANILTAVLSR